MPNEKKTLRSEVNNQEIKPIPELTISFSNGIPKKYIEAKGFKSDYIGNYNGCISLLKELTKAVEKFKEQDKTNEKRE